MILELGDKMSNPFAIRAIEKEYGIPYEMWPVGANTNYLDAVNMLNLRAPRVLHQIFLVYSLAHDHDTAVVGLDDIIAICRFIISQDYRVNSYCFDDDLIGIILRRAIVADMSGLVLLPEYIGLGYGHVSCWATNDRHRNYSSRENPLKSVM